MRESSRPAASAPPSTSVRVTSRWSRVWVAALATGALALTVGGYLLSANATPTVTTDRLSYAAGDEITIAGDGFAPHEIVTLVAVHEDGTAEPGAGHEPFQVQADEQGHIASWWAVNSADALGRRFHLVASGPASGPAQSPAFLRAPQLGGNAQTRVAGEALSIDGRDFAAGETVNFQVTHIDGTTDEVGAHDVFTAVANADGRVSAAWSPVAADIQGARLQVTARGEVSGPVAPLPLLRVANVEPDRGDYQPGETVSLAAFGFAPNEAVRFQVTHVTGSNDGNGHQPFYATADADGFVTTTWFVDPDDSLHSKFLVAARGEQSGVAGDATFWDAGTVSLTTFGTAATENFDTLANSGTTNTTLPTGWDFAESGTNANTPAFLYRAGNGSDNAGDTYSFGAASSTERAFGGLRSGSLTPTIGAAFTNNTPGTITSLAISFVGEQWRLGQNPVGRAQDRLDFQLSTDATSLTTGTWTDYNGLDFASPVLTGTLGALNGNASGSRTAVSSTLTGLAIPSGATFWIRWSDLDLVPGSDDGLAVDEVSVTPNGVVADAAPTVSSFSPANNAVDIALNANLQVTFSEPVNVSGNWFTLACGVSGTRNVVDTAVSTSDQTTFTINPSVDFALNEQCTLTVASSLVSDQDANDPPDTMALDAAATFSTVLPDPCTLPYTSIPAIQGNGATVALTGARATQGVVVGDYEGASPALRGFYIQDPAGDGDPSTSDGIFVFEGSNANTVSLGDRVYVSGTAGENQGQSQITASTIKVCGTDTVTPTDVTLPVESAEFLERYEGMLVRFTQALTVTEHFQLGRFGQVVLSSGGRLRQPTNVAAPGAAALAVQAANDLNRIIVDDASQTQNPDPIVFGRNGQPLSASNTLRGGDTATGLVGVLTYTWGGNVASPNAYRVRPINALNGSVTFDGTNPRPSTVPDVGGTVKVVGMNLLNFFNTFSGCTGGVGGAATDCRGADNSAEFSRQSDKTVAAILAMNPDVLGVNELENDGYGSTSAIRYLVDTLNAATAPGTYAFIDADANTSQVNAMGDDAIKIAVLYKPGVVTPVGQTGVLNTTAFVNAGDNTPRNRPSIAQAFEVNATTARFIVNVNHLKSKGSACDVPDNGDGQGNCNQVRVNAATELRNWLAADPTGTGDTDVLMVGDYNSYAKEDPIATIEAGNFVNLVQAFQGDEAYSYVFDGQWGYLDQALGSSSLVPQVKGVADYHINADEPSVLDYNTNFKTAGQVLSLYAPDQFRVSDHDPVIIGLKPNDAPTASAGGPYSVNEGASVLLSATGNDVNGDSLTYAWDLDNNGSFETSGQTATWSAAALDGPGGPYTVTVRVTDPDGFSAEATSTVTVVNVAPVVAVPTLSASPSLEGQAVVAAASFNDAGPSDGPFTCTVNYGDGSGALAGVVSGTTCTGPSHVYSTFGSYTVTVAVTDKDAATGTRSTTQDVNFSFTGFLQPVDNLPVVNGVKAGQAIPLKFKLGGNKGLSILSSVTAALANCSTGVSDDLSPADAATAGNSALQYDAGTGTYIYVWKTDKAWAGQCRLLTLRLADDTVYSALFQLK